MKNQKTHKKSQLIFHGKPSLLTPLPSPWDLIKADWYYFPGLI